MLYSKMKHMQQVLNDQKFLDKEKESIMTKNWNYYKHDKYKGFRWNNPEFIISKKLQKFYHTPLKKAKLKIKREKKLQMEKEKTLADKQR